MSSRRDYKDFAAGECYHVFNRGNDKKDIFREASDYALMLFRLREILGKSTVNDMVIEHLPKVPFGHGQSAQPTGRGDRHRRKSFPRETFSLVAFCLMPNHFHFILQQHTDVSISELMLSLLGGYSKYFNKKYERVGSLFQDQFKANHIEDNTQLLHLSAYAHHNPKNANLVSDSADYIYSSYREYLGVIAKYEMISNPELVLSQFGGAHEYKSFMDDSFETIKRNKEFTSVFIDD